jgi:hypothetical protein
LNKRITLTILVLSLVPIIGITFGQTILDFIVTPTITNTTESESVVIPTSQVTLPDPVILNGTTVFTTANTTESESVVVPTSQVTLPDPVILNGTTTSTTTNTTESVSIVAPVSFSQTPTISPITKTSFTSEGSSSVPQPDPVITTTSIFKTNFTSIGSSSIPEPDPVITTTVITKSTFQSVGTITTVQPNHNFCDPTPISGDWIVQSSCILSLNSTIDGNVIVQNGVVLEIPSGVTLDIDFANHNLTVKSGGGVLIKNGGSIT